MHGPLVARDTGDKECRYLPLALSRLASDMAALEVACTWVWVLVMRRYMNHMP